MIRWEIDAREMANCNCNWGCPCQFNAPPTHGNCQAVTGFEIDRGYFGDVQLNGLRAVSVLSWPGAIHEGRGKVLTIIDARADDEQRSALLTIMSGAESEPGATVFSVFAATMETVLDPLFKPIDFEVDIEARTGRIRVEGMIDVRCEPIRNPVTGAEHRVRIDMPEDSFEYSLAEMGSGTSTVSGPIALDLQNSYAQLARLHLNNDGVIR